MQDSPASRATRVAIRFREMLDDEEVRSLRDAVEFEIAEAMNDVTRSQSHQIKTTEVSKGH